MTTVGRRPRPLWNPWRSWRRLLDPTTDVCGRPQEIWIGSGLVVDVIPYRRCRHQSQSLLQKKDTFNEK